MHSHAHFETKHKTQRLWGEAAKILEKRLRDMFCFLTSHLWRIIMK